MTTHTRNADWKTAPTNHVEAAGTRFAYRRLGPDAGVPAVLLNHWGANLDNFDPPIVEGLAVDQPVYALDYRGIGASGGTAPLSVAEMASDTIATIRALGLTSVDLIGFSLGGFVAQQMLLDAPDLVRRAILAGTGPAGGPGIERVGSVSWPIIGAIQMLVMRGRVTVNSAEAYIACCLGRPRPDPNSGLRRQAPHRCRRAH